LAALGFLGHDGDYPRYPPGRISLC
jgi:hypothetical protein